MQDARDTLHRLGLLHGLPARQHRQLLALSQPRLDTAHGPRAVLLLASLLLGLAVVMAVASQWGEWSRGLRFALLQVGLLVAGGAALAVARARTACGLLMFIGQGALLAFFGQTYQTGADPWQLFALWTLLGLPMALALRHDALWSPWSLVASVGVVLAVQTFGGRDWWVTEEQRAALWLGAAVLVGLVLVFATRRLGHGPWAARVQALWTCTVVGGWAVFGWWVGGSHGVSLGLGLMLVAALAWLWKQGDAVLLALLALALDAWLLAGLARLMFGGGDKIGALFLYALLAAGLLAATVSLVLRRLRAGGAA